MGRCSSVVGHDSQHPRRVRPARSQDSISSQHCARRPPQRHPLPGGLFPFEAGSVAAQASHGAELARFVPSLSLSRRRLFSSSFQASTQPPSAPLAACKPLDLLVPWLRLSLLIASHAKHAVGKESLLLALLSAGAHPVKGPAVWPPSLPFPSPPLSSNRGRPGRLWRTSTAALEIRSGRARRRQGNEIFIVCESHRRRRGQKKNDPCAV